ncbi:MAG: hypothetical protein M3380_12625 [Chloroflexota bacterium]|nr:hypothetical protein [Chloroflexota bacterium]
MVLSTGKGETTSKQYVWKYLRKLRQAGLLPPEQRLHPKEEEILALAAREDLSQLTAEQIAERVGITGPWRKEYAWRYLKKLRAKGLLSDQQKG